jgi:hypothetical protein
MPQQGRDGGPKDFAKLEEYEESAGSIPDEFLNKRK